MRLALQGLCALLCLLASSLAQADDITGKVIGVADGDTITVLHDSSTQIKIRLAGIDAPEKSQAFGSRAKQSLSDKVFGQQVTVKVDTQDRYGRSVANIYLGDRWINKEQLEEGFAWHYRQYSKDATLADAEKNARTAGKGLWADANPQPPWEFRHGGSSRQDAAPQKLQLTQSEPQASAPVVAADHQYWLNTKSGVRHNERCKHFGSTGSGRACLPTEGKPCGICGG